MRKNNKNPQILPPSILIHQQQHTFKQVINSVDEKLINSDQVTRTRVRFAPL